MRKRTFVVSFFVEATVELDDQVIDVVDDEWRSYLYDLYTPEEIASHVAYNLLQGTPLSSMDGWADQPRENAKLVDSEWDEDDCYEVKDKND